MMAVRSTRMRLIPSAATSYEIPRDGTRGIFS